MPNNPFQNLPQGWEVKTLGEVCEITMGQSPKGEYVSDKAQISKNMAAMEFHQGKICFTDKYLLESEFVTTDIRKIAEKDSILLCVRAPVGIINIVKRKVAIGRGLCALKMKGQNNDFLYFYLLTLENYFNQKATGSTFSAITMSVVKNTPIPLPPLETQQRIVAKLESEFAKIESAKSHLEKVKETIPRLKNSLLKSAFSGELTQPHKDEKGAHYHCEDSLESEVIYNAESPKDSIAESKVCEIVDSHELRCNSRNDASVAQTSHITQISNLGGATLVAQNLQDCTNPTRCHSQDRAEESQNIKLHKDSTSRDISLVSQAQYDKEDNLPQGWEVKTLGEIFEVIGGGTPSTEKSEFWNGDIAWITSANIASENFTITPQKFINHEAIKSSATKLVPKNTIIVVTRVGLGKVGITSIETCFSQDSQALLPLQMVDTKFMAFQIKKEASQFIINSRGTTISGITKDTLKKLKLKIPPLETQKQIVEILDSKFAALENLEKETNASLEKLQKLKSSLLNLAFKGELIC